MTNMMLHAGGFAATAEEVEAAEAPEATATYQPISHRDFLDTVRTHLPRFGLPITAEKHALGAKGQRYFGVLSCRLEALASNGNDFELAVGLRNSYDQSFAADLIAGTRVFVCDNLAFSGEVRVNRRHTRNLLKDLPGLIYQMLDALVSMKGGVIGEVEAMKEITLDRRDADHVLVESVRIGALPGRYLQNVLQAYERPLHPEFEPRTAWSLMNAFTQVAKERPAQLQMTDGLRLTGIFRQTFALEAIAERLRQDRSGLKRPDDLVVPAGEPSAN